MSTAIENARTSVFFDLVDDFREAQKAAGATKPGSQIHAEAQRLMNLYNDRAFTLTIACMLACENTFDYETTVAEYAALTGGPRGICGRH